MWNRRHRWIRRLTAGLAFATLVVPTVAQAKVVEDTGIVAKGSRIAYGDIGYQQSPGVPVKDQRSEGSGITYTYNGKWVAVQANQPGDSAAVRPDDKAVRFSPQGEAPVVTAAPSDGFSWGDAGIGAGTAFGLVLLALGAAATMKRGGRETLAGA